MQLLGPRGTWRPLLGIVLVALLFVLCQLLLSALFGIYGLLFSDDSYDVTELLSGDPVTPAFLAYVNLGWAVAIPITWVVARSLHLIPQGFLASVAGRLRWRWFATCLVLAVVALILTLTASSLLPDQGDATVEMDGTVNAWTSATRDFLLVIVLLTPLQAAGEEYVFRGYLAQAFGGLVSRWGSRASAAVAVALPAALFALAHGASQDVPIFFDRFAFGVVAGALVLLTGGLEAGIAMHVLNNFLAFGLALAYGDMTEALQPTGGSWWSIPVTLTQSVSFLLLVLWAARRSGIETRTGPGVLAARGGPV
ncbi:CPBP family intramembrane metalloprotease [Nocardioides caeni]|uniref:CPBP family intramembrane metalloprotease n=1 Tax=Nocardioides caeni TaxID=574700 RepID=A0A4S8NNH1_9ACTN|nr:CPBP family intramembrane metalloprotease [Nocardioides caeni]